MPFATNQERLLNYGGFEYQYSLWCPIEPYLNAKHPNKTIDYPATLKKYVKDANYQYMEFDDIQMNLLSYNWKIKTAEVRYARFTKRGRYNKIVGDVTLPKYITYIVRLHVIDELLECEPIFVERHQR